MEKIFYRYEKKNKKNQKHRLFFKSLLEQNMKPKRERAIKYRKENSRFFLIYDPRSGNSYLLNFKILNIFKLCNGKRNIEKIKQITRLDQKTIINILKELKENNLICFN